MAKKNPNPQGKGLTPVVQQRQELLASAIPDKSASQILTDYAISLLVLSARFQFKPSPGQTYTLYLKQYNLGLSLIEPEAWPESMGKPIARCQLNNDMTWHIGGTLFDPKDKSVVRILDSFLKGFEERLSASQSLEQGLPYFAGHLPFYPRLFANVMAKSLEQSLQQSNLVGRNQHYWLTQLDSSKLLTTTIEK
ncbi:hypothetical protein HMF8227_00019 [Saliniradius amylolyticus]|uniref:Uncharacterized protein n=1 Tax=Saliniradius amylolyticus TaxID=2183582 RepID=A0A2S2DZ22_9ALTE|nr:DUF2452 domain-containing protein [Saliniradius amylolyticus]AWL10532.1 hypothetical protein HMF8227_00019 [Saliniradius amylolyticus]